MHACPYMPAPLRHLSNSAYLSRVCNLGVSGELQDKCDSLHELCSVAPTGHEVLHIHQRPSASLLRIGIQYPSSHPSPAATCRMGSNEAIHSPTMISLVAKSPFSPCSNPLGLTSAAPVCNLFAQSEQSHSRQATSMATFKLCSGQASAMVYSGSVALPAQARCHHFQTAACHLAFLSLSKLVYHHHYYCWHGAFSSARGHPHAHHVVSCVLSTNSTRMLSDRMQGRTLSTSAQSSDHRPLALPG